MIVIKTSGVNAPEKEYIIDVFFNNFLGIDYKLDFSSDNFCFYEIELSSGNKLVIEDAFFFLYKKPLEYLKREAIPENICFAKNEFTSEEDIPVIYGRDFLLIERKNRKKIICGIDIFASAFFMLTRWEEYVNQKRDRHDRFPASESLAMKWLFLNRPVVNEYLEMFWNMLVGLGYDKKRKVRKFEPLVTHDVDKIQKYGKIWFGLKRLIQDLILHRSLSLFCADFFSELKVILGLRKDPFDTFDKLMKISETKGFKSYFFFMENDPHRYSITEKKTIKLILEIQRRGHFIGMHPNYNTYNDEQQFLKEKNGIEKIVRFILKSGRNHYLQFRVPQTWQIWNDAGMEWDSTLSYADKEGFRCGTCYSYPVFNFLTRRKLKLEEKPLILMDGTLLDYQQYTKTEAFAAAKILIDRTFKYNGNFVFLWHNSSFNTSHWVSYAGLYEQIIDYLCSRVDC
jgi:hypothetical protein